MPPQHSSVCLCVCGVCKGLDWAGKDLSILGRCTRSKLHYVIVSASQMMVDAFMPHSTELEKRGGEGKEDLCEKLCVHRGQGCKT